MKKLILSVLTVAVLSTTGGDGFPGTDSTLIPPKGYVYLCAYSNRRAVSACPHVFLYKTKKPWNIPTCPIHSRVYGKKITPALEP